MLFEELDLDCIRSYFVKPIRVARILTNEGFYTKYFVFSDGRVFALKGRKLEELYYSQKKKKNTYVYVHLRDDGIEKMNWLLHRLVALAFIPNPENKPQVNHKDGVKTNNDVSNLEWATAHENMVHSYVTGLHKIGFGDESNNPKINRKTAVKICEYLEENKLSLDEIAEITGCTKTIVYNIKHKFAWEEVSKNYHVENHDVRKDGVTYMGDEIVHGICRDLEANELSASMIAEKYGVSYSKINEIRQHHTWTRISSQYNIDNYTPKGTAGHKHIKKLHKVCELLQDTNLSVNDIHKMVDIPEDVINGILYNNMWKHISRPYDFERRLKHVS